MLRQNGQRKVVLNEEEEETYLEDPTAIKKNDATTRFYPDFRYDTKFGPAMERHAGSSSAANHPDRFSSVPLAECRGREHLNEGSNRYLPSSK